MTHPGSQPPRLSSTDFAAFFEALWGYSPFPWQHALLCQVAEGAGWPHTLDLPTGSGKTAVLDIATFALALDALRPTDDRVHPRRVALVIDRRVVVDQGFQRARDICERISQAREGILDEVRRALQLLSWQRTARLPIEAAILRGGMVRDHDWARTPDQPLLLVSTVDQVGSRLLFRGYGVSERMAPVHAGLLGSDTLFLLDEVHLSHPFEQTLDQLRRYATSPLVPQPVGRPVQLVCMSATAGKVTVEPFRLSAADRAHDTLNARLSARKLAALPAPIKLGGDEAGSRAAIARSCVAHAKALFEDPSNGVVAIIVNRVDTALRAAREAANARWMERADIELALITGRMRPLDRRQLEEQLLPRIRAGRDRKEASKILIISTQAVEAGADLRLRRTGHRAGQPRRLEAALRPPRSPRRAAPIARRGGGGRSHDSRRQQRSYLWRCAARHLGMAR